MLLLQAPTSLLVSPSVELLVPPPALLQVPPPTVMLAPTSSVLLSLPLYVLLERQRSRTSYATLGKKKRKFGSRRIGKSMFLFIAFTKQTITHPCANLALP